MYLVAVHAGAGFHSIKNEKQYKADMLKACEAAKAKLEAGGSAMDAVEAAVIVLENAAITNAGHGSNLNLDGAVECDASIMDDSGAFGAVGAAPGIHNPIQAATLLAKESTQPLSHGLVRPMMLVGDQARKWALGKGLQCAATANEAQSLHVTEKTKQQWRKYMAMLQETEDASSDGIVQNEEDSSDDNSQQQKPKKRKLNLGAQNDNIEEDEDQQALNDTVGCVVVDAQGRVASGVSSGGIVLKIPGRVGEAAVFGAGCWAHRDPQSVFPEDIDWTTARPPVSGAIACGHTAVACSVTGVGERIMSAMVARECGKECLKYSNQGCAEECEEALSLSIMCGPPPRECGVLCATVTKTPAIANAYFDVDVELGVAFAAPSMAVGYIASNVDGNMQYTMQILRKKKGDDEMECQKMSYGLSWKVGNP